MSTADGVSGQGLRTQSHWHQLDWRSTQSLLHLPDEILENIMMHCDCYAAIALSRTCRYMTARMNEAFWKQYSEPMRRRFAFTDESVDIIHERTFLEYVLARAKSNSSIPK